MSTSQQSVVLERLTSFRTLRGIKLAGCSEDWTVLTKIPSLRTLTFTSCDSQLELFASSPFLKAWIQATSDVPWFQEWKRSDDDGQFHLAKLLLHRHVSFENPVWKSLPLESHLCEIDLSADTSLRALRHCPSLRTLGLNRVEDVSVIAEVLEKPSSISSLRLDVDSEKLADGSFIDLSPLRLSSLKSFTLSTPEQCTIESLAQVLTKSKPKSLTNLALDDLHGGLEPLADALLECPALANLSLTSTRDVLPVVQILYRLPLTTLNLHSSEFSDESIECLSSYLSQSAVQDLNLGVLSPKQLQLVADVLPSLPSLQSFWVKMCGFDLCQHESAHLALFSALARSSLCSLTLSSSYFRLGTLMVCLDKIPESQLTRCHFADLVVYTDNFDATLATNNNARVDPRTIPFDWSVRFPQIKDRFCLVACRARSFLDRY
jgi:hypothetical protein